MNNLTVEQNAKRTEIMNELYKLDERDKPGPHQGTFTGLGQEIEIYKKFKKELAIYEKWNARNYPLS
mgnify:CR=1 FL=1